jgi:hypothetical protein
MPLRNFPILLHDGRLAGYSTESGDVVVSIVEWDETPLRLRCREIVLFKDVVGDGDLETLIECDEAELLREFKEHLARVGYAASEVEQFRHFRLLDSSNIAVLDVICKEIVEEQPTPGKCTS